MTEQQPTVGRIVIYVTSDAEGEINGTREHPAIVTRNWNEGPLEDGSCVNLKVLCDGPDNLWATSVGYDPEGSPRSWHWPPRN